MGKSTDIVQRLDQARAEGIQITADIYPYDFWLSDLGVQFPKRDFDNKTSAEFALRELTPPEGMILSRYDARPEWVGKSIADIALDRKEDPADTYMYLIKLAHEAKAEESVMGRSMTESDIVTFMQWPQANICSDGFGEAAILEGPAVFPGCSIIMSKCFRFSTRRSYPKNDFIECRPYGYSDERKNQPWIFCGPGHHRP